MKFKSLLLEIKKKGDKGWISLISDISKQTKFVPFPDNLKYFLMLIVDNTFRELLKLKYIYNALNVKIKYIGVSF